MAAELVAVVAGMDEVVLPHQCAGNQDGIRYRIGPRGLERLAAGETVPVTARCERCDGRVFASLVDSAARDAARAAARPDPSALRAPSSGERLDPRTGRVVMRPRLRVVPSPSVPVPTVRCEACGVVPDEQGRCRCSM